MMLNVNTSDLFAAGSFLLGCFFPTKKHEKAEQN